MTVLTDVEIKQRKIISRCAYFSTEIEGLKGPSYGLSAAGYDLRLGPRFKRPRPGRIIAASDMAEDDWEDFYEDGTFVLKPNEFLLGHSLEKIKMPKDYIGLCVNKSSYIRAGVNAHATVVEPGWEGHLTVEIKNQLPHNGTCLYPGFGILQIVFIKTNKTPMTTYDKRNGKYMHQGAYPVISR